MGCIVLLCFLYLQSWLHAADATLYKCMNVLHGAVSSGISKCVSRVKLTHLLQGLIPLHACAQQSLCGGPPTAALVAYAATHGFSAAKALWLAVTGIGHQPLQAEGGLLVLAALAAALVYDNGLLAAGRFIGQVCGAADMTQDCACALLWSSIHASRLHALRTGCARVATHAHHECLQDTHTPPLRYTGMVLDYRART